MCAYDIYFLRQIDGVLGLWCPQIRLLFLFLLKTRKKNILWAIQKRFIYECWRNLSGAHLISTDRLSSILRQSLQQTLTIMLIYRRGSSQKSCFSFLNARKLWAVKIQDSFFIQFLSRWYHLMVLLTFIFLSASWSVQIGLFLGSLRSRLCCASEMCRVYLPQRFICGFCCCVNLTCCDTMQDNPQLSRAAFSFVSSQPRVMS